MIKSVRMKNNVRWLTFAAASVIVAGLFFASCEKYSYLIEEIDPTVPVRFDTDIQPVFNDNCIMCHKGTRPPDLRAENSYEALTTGGYVDPPAAGSKLYKKITTGSHASYISKDTDKQLIYNWIEQGAKNSNK